MIDLKQGVLMAYLDLMSSLINTPIDKLEESMKDDEEVAGEILVLKKAINEFTEEEYNQFCNKLNRIYSEIGCEIDELKKVVSNSVGG